MAIFMTCTTTRRRLSLASSLVFSAAWMASFSVSVTECMGHNHEREHKKRAVAALLGSPDVRDQKRRGEIGCPSASPGGVSGAGQENVQQDLRKRIGDRAAPGV